MIIPTKKAVGTAHGKIILIGEHSVVHNQPAIAIPFTSAKVNIEITESLGETVINSLYYEGQLVNAPKTLTNLKKTIDAVALYLGKVIQNIRIDIDSNIPAERGMGSSAAVATALVRALFNYFEVQLTDDLLENFVSISEEIAHGNPSGIDAQVVRSNESVYFIRKQETKYFDARLNGFLLVADTGQPGETIHAVEDVKNLVDDKNSRGEKWIHELGDLTNKAYQEIKEKEIKKLGKSLSEAQKLLRNLTVSNESLDNLVATAMKNGALGAKLTGGGRGGCMIALVENKEDAYRISATLSKVGAVKTWIHPLGVNMNE
ncbi:MAG: mevalonate kinase [Pisciglobus halotolerans]|nr:mevalonate kinase [Atopostipes sp.]MDN6626552.1 mevalonate kinase [Pisciglobus halotolerans]MDN6731579.1 mevalonate kinase [Atopostipes suicloacalis]